MEDKALKRKASFCSISSTPLLPLSHCMIYPPNLDLIIFLSWYTITAIALYENIFEVLTSAQRHLSSNSQPSVEQKFVYMGMANIPVMYVGQTLP